MKEERLAFLDAARGIALVLMVVNHTARHWLGPEAGAERIGLIYVTTTVAGPTFLFLVGWVLPMSARHARHPVRRLLRRASWLVIAGYALNLIVFPEQPGLGSNVLHMIGFGIALSIPLLHVLHYPLARPALVVLAVLVYASFGASFDAATRWVAAHPGPALVAFFDFPPWPWISMVLLGLVAGSTAPDQRGPRLARTVALVGGLGLTALAGFAAHQAWIAPPGPLAFSRDFVLNNHWIPRGATVLWVLGAVFSVVALAYWLTEVRGYRLRGLVVLGQTAFFLYFLHHLLVVNLVQRALGVAFGDWLAYGAATALLIALLVPLGVAWRRLRTPPGKAQRLYTAAPWPSSIERKRAGQP